MGIELGEMWVRYKADVSDLASKMSQAKSSMSSANDSAQSAGSGIFSAFTNAGSSLMNFGSQVVQGLSTLQNLGQGAVSLAENLLAPAASAETMDTAFTTLLGSTKAANDEMQKLDQFASKTPFTTMDIDKAASQLVGFGANANDVVPDLTAIGDALSAVGRGSAANLDSVVNIFGKIQTEGKLSVGTMQELSVNGVNAWSVLEQQTGKTKDELTKMIQAGLFPANDAIKDLTTGIEKNPLYTGGMAKQSNTMTGIVSTLKSNWDQMLVSLGSPILKSLEPIMANIGTALTSPGFKSFAGDVGQGIVGVFDDIGNVVGPVVTGLQGFGSALNDEPLGVFLANLHDLGNTLNNWLYPVISGIGLTVFGQFKGVLSGVGGQVLDLINNGLYRLGDIFHSVSGDVVNFSKFLSKIDFSSLTGGAIKSAEGLGTQLMPAVKNIASLMSGQFMQTVRDVGQVAQQMGGWFITSVVPAIKQAMPGFESLGKVLLTTVVPAILQVREVGMQFIEHVVKDFGPLIEKMIPPLIVFAGVMAGDIAQAITFLTPIILQVAQTVGTFADELSDRLAPIAIKVFTWISEQVTTFAHYWGIIWPGVSQVLAGVWTEIRGFIQIAWSLVSGIILIGLDILSGNWSQAWTDLKNMLGGIWDGIKTLVSGGIDTIKGIITTVWDGLSGLLSKPFNDAWNAIQGIIGNIQGAINNVTGGIGNGLANIGIHIPGHAAGGNNLPAGWSIIGEKGPELQYTPQGASILPNSVFQGLMSGQSAGPSLSVQNNGGGGSSSGDIHVHNQIFLDGQEMTNQIMTRAVKQIRMQGGRMGNI